jgi:hypothetical protein
MLAQTTIASNDETSGCLSRLQLVSSARTRYVPRKSVLGADRPIREQVAQRKAGPARTQRVCCWPLHFGPRSFRRPAWPRGAVCLSFAAVPPNSGRRAYGVGELRPVLRSRMCQDRPPAGQDPQRHDAQQDQQGPAILHCPRHSPALHCRTISPSSAAARLSAPSCWPSAPPPSGSVSRLQGPIEIVPALSSFPTTADTRASSSARVSLGCAWIVSISR